MYYSGRDNPPHPEIWINYFLRMVELYSKKAYELSLDASSNELTISLSYLNIKEKEFLKFILENHINEFSPIEISKKLNVTNKTVINRCTKLTSNGFLTPNIVKERIRTYSLTDYTKDNTKQIITLIKKDLINIIP